MVFSHAESGGGLTFEGSGSTNINGVSTVPGATAGDTVITVDAVGYDLFTFHGVPRNSLEVLLDVSSEPAAAVQGKVTSVFPTGNFSGAATKVADTRAPRLRRLSDVSLCSPNSNATLFECNYGPVLIEGSSLGAISFLATQDDLPQFTFNPVTYLRGFGLTAPLLAVAAGAPSFVIDAVVTTLAALPMRRPWRSWRRSWVIRRPEVLTPNLHSGSRPSRTSSGRRSRRVLVRMCVLVRIGLTIGVCRAGARRARRGKAKTDLLGRAA